MNYFSRIMFGLSLVNAVLMAAADKKITKAEVQMITSVIMSGLGVNLKLLPTDLDLEWREDGSVALVFSPNLLAKLKLAM